MKIVPEDEELLHDLTDVKKYMSQFRLNTELTEFKWTVQTELFKMIEILIFKNVNWSRQGLQKIH